MQCLSNYIYEKKVNFKWFINKFSDGPKTTGSRITSSKFVIKKGIFNTEWSLIMFPRGSSAEYQDYMSLSLLCSKSTCPIYINYSFSIINSNNEKVNTHKSESMTKVDINTEIKKNEFINIISVLEEDAGLIVDDKLTILCEVNVKFIVNENQYMTRNVTNSMLKYPDKPPNELICISELDNENQKSEIQFKWFIQNIKDTIGDLKSASFVLENITWYLLIHQEERQMHDDYVSLSLNASSAIQKCVTFKLILLNKKNIKITELFVEKKQFHQINQHRFHNFIQRNALLDQIEGDSLRIDCTISIDKTNIQNISNTFMIEYNKPDYQILLDFNNLLSSENFSDITITVGEKKIKAHKAILAARNTVFAAMFTHDMEETNNNIIDITDIDFDVVKEMLSFIYTGKSPNIESMADRLLVAADKYSIEALKIRCTDVLVQNITFNNAINILILSESCYISVLKDSSMQFICNNLSHIMKTDGWNQMLMLPELCNELFNKLAINKMISY